MPVLTLVDAVLALAVEVALLAAAVRGGWLIAPDGGWQAWSAGLVCAVGVAVLWGLLLAPASPRRLELPWLLIVKAGLYLLGTAVLVLTAAPRLGAVFGVAGLVSLVLGYLVARQDAG